MKRLWTLRTILLLPPLVVVVLAAVIGLVTLYQLKLQFDDNRTRQAHYMALKLESARLTEGVLAQQQQVRDALSGAQERRLDELSLYFIHSDVVNALADMKQRIDYFEQRPEIMAANPQHAGALGEFFDGYRRFMIMATDIIAIDPLTADRYIHSAHDHFTSFNHLLFLVGANLLDHVQQMQQRDAELIEQLYWRTLLLSLLALLLVYLVGRWVAMRLSGCLLTIAAAMDRLGRQPHDPPEIPEIDRLLDRTHGEIHAIAAAVDQFRTSLIERNAQQERIHQLAYFDPLTGLGNRRLLLDQLDKALRAIERQPQHCALLFIDLDLFKNLNDTLGHSAGDRVLQEAASRLHGAVGSEGLVVRNGSDEFAVLLTELSAQSDSAADQVRHVGERLLEGMRRPFLLEGEAYSLSASIGVSHADSPLATADQLLQNADLALFQAKASGRNCMRFFDEAMQTAVSLRTRMESELRVALRERQLCVHYQPQIDAGGQVLGYEALVRWNHPERGLIPPFEFIPLAEESGLIIELGQQVLEMACRQLAAWQSQADKAQWSISVNVSSLQFAQASFVQSVETVVAETGANPHRLKLELTESMLLEEIDPAIDKMAALSRLGIRFALDDFGTGYSSLSYLKHLPLTWLKIDQSFVRDMLEDSEDEAIVVAVIQLAQALGLQVIAEGVETEAHYQRLLALGCREFQGYHFGRPAPLE